MSDSANDVLYHFPRWIFCILLIRCACFVFSTVSCVHRYKGLSRGKACGVWSHIRTWEHEKASQQRQEESKITNQIGDRTVLDFMNKHWQGNLSINYQKLHKTSRFLLKCIFSLKISTKTDNSLKCVFEMENMTIQHNNQPILNEMIVFKS